jgi:hypothetical protein
MAMESDALCREYGLSVIEKPTGGKSKHYSEWQAERNGHTTWRGMVKSDVDAAIRQSMTERQFFDNLLKIGYEIKGGKDISVRPPGKERFVRLHRNFGEDYTMAAINRRILTQASPQRVKPEPNKLPPKRVQYRGTTRRPPRIVGFRALYVRYCHMLNGRPQWQILQQPAQRPLTDRQVNIIFRDDIRKMRQIGNEMKLLGVNRIDSAGQLASLKEDRTRQIAELNLKRQQLRNTVRREKDDPAVIITLKAEITGLSKQLGVLCREVKLCDNIETRTAAMREKIRLAAVIRAQNPSDKQQGKELNANDQRRGRR